MKISFVIKWFVISVIAVILTYAWVGFLSPDPFFMHQMGFSGILVYLWGPRIFIPINLSLILLWGLTKKKKLKQNIVLLFSSFIAIALIGYPVADYIYNNRQIIRLNEIKQHYNPYLQLMPPTVPEKEFSNLNDSCFTIFCIGGSTTQFNNSEGIGWPEMVDQNLREKYNKNVKVFNFGRQWYSTMHSCINYKANLRRYKPDLIIIMHNINDLLYNADFSYLSGGEFRPDYGHFYGATANLLKPTSLMGRNLEKFKSMMYYKERNIIEQDSFPGIKSFRKNIELLSHLAKQDSTKVLLMTQPNIYTDSMNDEVKKQCIMVNFEAVGETKYWSYHTAYIGMKQYNDEVKLIAKENDFYCIDLDKQVPKTLDYFNDDVHYKDGAFPIIANLIAMELVQLDIIK